MTQNALTYKDRFGNEWSARVQGPRGKPRRVSFRCKDFRLVAIEDEAAERAPITKPQLKELFCDAERVFKHEGETWHVGYRKRMGRGGQNHAGLHTRFRSEDGEVRYAKGMLHFRHMPKSLLREHLEAAAPSAKKIKDVSWAT